MGVKNIVKSAGEGTVKGVKSVGKGMKTVGKGVLVIGNTVYSSTFIVAQIAGLVMMVAGIIIICIMAGKKFGLTNLKPLFTMITGEVGPGQKDQQQPQESIQHQQELKEKGSQVLSERIKKYNLI